MINSKTKLGIGILIIFLIGILFILLSSPDYQTPDTTTPISDYTDNTVTTTTTYSMSIVSTHDNQQSCWTIVGGNVYDVTSWISQHPGGPDKILSLCGKDGTSNFTGKHGGQEKPETMLQSFLIGQLE